MQFGGSILTRVAAVVLLCSVPLVTIAGVRAEGSPVTSGAQQGAIANFLTLPGDRVVTVPDGVYSGGEVQAPHPATSGPYGGWLILVAERKHGVVVDLSAAPLRLLEETSRIAFVGFAFTGGRLYVHGEDIRFWYTDHTYPDYRVIDRTPDIPRMMYLRGAKRVDVQGSDFHEGNASVLTIDRVQDVSLQGVRMWDVEERPETDPHDLSHANNISVLNGRVKGLTVRDSYFEGNRINLQAADGDITDVVFENVWYTSASGSAFHFNAMNSHRVVGSRVNVRSWAHRGARPNDRLDVVEGTPVRPGSERDRVDVDDLNVTESAPASGPDPAQAWRAANPYGAWGQIAETDSTEARVDWPRILSVFAAVLMLSVILRTLLPFLRRHPAPDGSPG